MAVLFECFAIRHVVALRWFQLSVKARAYSSVLHPSSPSCVFKAQHFWSEESPGSLDPGAYLPLSRTIFYIGINTEWAQLWESEEIFVHGNLFSLQASLTLSQLSRYQYHNRGDINSDCILIAFWLHTISKCDGLKVSERLSTVRVTDFLVGTVATPTAVIPSCFQALLIFFSIGHFFNPRFMCTSWN